MVDLTSYHNASMPSVGLENFTGAPAVPPAGSPAVPPAGSPAVPPAGNPAVPPAPTGNAKAPTGNAKAPTGNAKAPAGNAKAPAGNAKAPTGNAKINAHAKDHGAADGKQSAADKAKGSKVDNSYSPSYGTSSYGYSPFSSSYGSNNNYQQSSSYSAPPITTVAVTQPVYSAPAVQTPYYGTSWFSQQPTYTTSAQKPEIQYGYDPNTSASIGMSVILLGVLIYMITNKE